ncbi:MAG TPA: hypothetical protein VKB25_04820 [Conexibacter sp.]|nr:hypothetical protein [Conexibacter sp.]
MTTGVRVLGRPVVVTLSVATATAALLSFVAGDIHFLLVEPHLHEWWAYGWFFVVVAVGQGAFAGLVLLRQPPWLLLTAIAGNLAILGMYVLSRTNGPPLGPHAGVPERVAALDVVCTAAELGVIVACLVLLPARIARGATTVLAVVGIALWTGRLTGVLL